MNRSLSVSVAAVALLFTGFAHAADFRLGFEGPACGKTIKGQPGEEKTIVVLATLDTFNNTSFEGVQGWSLSIAVDGPLAATSPISATVKGVIVNTVYDEDDDNDPSTSPVHHDSYDFDLGGAFINVATRASLDTDPTKLGAVSAVVLKSNEKMALQQNGHAQILRLTIKAVIPATKPSSPNLKLSFVNGYKSALSRPVPNVVTYRTDSITPAFSTCEITLAPETPAGPEFKLALVPDIDGLKTPAASGDTIYQANVPAGNATVPVIVLLTTAGLPAGDGPQGWSLSVRNDTPCAKVTTVTVKGVIVNTVYEEDADGDPGTDPIHHENFKFDLGGAFTNIASPGATNKAKLPGNPEGAVSAVVLKSQEKMGLYQNTTDTLLRMVFTVPVVAGQTTDCRVFFEDGLVSAVSRPVPNVITYNRESRPPTTSQGLRIQLTGEALDLPVLHRHGDTNHDGKTDIADAIRIVMAVVPGLPGGSPLDCPAEGDVNADDRLELPDAIYYLNWQFRGGPQPEAPFPACAQKAGVTQSNCKSPLCP